MEDNSMGKRSNGEGTIFKRSDGRWCGAYYVGNKRKFVYGKTQKMVKERLQQLKQESSEEKQDSKTFGNWVLEYLENYKKNDIKESTYGTYLVYYRKHIQNSEIGKKTLEELTTDDLQKYYNKMLQSDLSAKTVRHLSVIINEALRQAVKLRKIKVNVNASVVLPKKIKFEGKTLSKEDVARLADKAKDEELYSLVMTTIFTGMRKGEVLGLTWDCVHLEQGCLDVKKSLCRVVDHMDEKGKMVSKLVLLEPKNKSSIREIPLPDFIVDILRKHRDQQLNHQVEWADIYNNQNLVFAREDGNFLSPRQVLADYYKMLDKYGIERVRFHDLRHTYASLLMESETDLKVIQELMGHSSISTTMDIYTHLKMEQKRNSVEKMADLFDEN
jgi:integrase